MLLSRLLSGVRFGAASPESQRFDLNSPEAWDNLGASRSSTGQVVTAESALTWDAWYRGVTLLSLYIAKTPLNVWRKVNEGSRDVRRLANDHDAHRLLRWKANEVQTAFQLQLALAGHAINRGNGYAYIERAGARPTGLLLLDPDSTHMARGSVGRWYVTRLPSGEDRKIPAPDVLHLRGFGFDGFTGYPAWQMAKECIGLATSMTKFKAVRYKNQARPSVVLETPNKMQKENRKELREDWERMHTGIENSHRTAILDNGLKVSKMTFTADEMQEVEQSGLNIRQAANFLGIPSSKLGDVAGIKYASKEQDDLAFLNDGLDFWFVALEDEARDKMLLDSEHESGEYSIEFNRSVVARGDSAARANYYRTALAGQPWLTQNEVREDDGREPSDDEGADELKTPLNMGQGGADNKPRDVSQPGPGKPSQDDEQSINRAQFRESAAAVMADASRRMVRRIGVHAAKASKDPKTFIEWIGGIEADHGRVACEAFAASVQMARVLTPILGEPVARLFALITADFNALADTTTGAKLPAAVESLVAEQEHRIPTALVKEFLP